jgi:hypothetical protein
MLLSVPDQVYFRNASCAINLTSTFLLQHLTTQLLKQTAKTLFYFPLSFDGIGILMQWLWATFENLFPLPMFQYKSRWRI